MTDPPFPNLSHAHATTILGIKREGQIAIAGDGQVTVGTVVMKATANKLRRLHHGKVIAGFAGSVADAFTLFAKFEAQLEAQHGKLMRAAVGLAQEWRTDRYLRRLEAMLIVADAESILVLSGMGDVFEPEGDIAAIGSGGPYALAAARALAAHTNLGAEEIAREALGIAADLCIYTNREIRVETLPS